jgi:hypothetical protein
MEKELNHRFSFYKDLLQAGEYHSALTYLAAISHCVPKLDTAAQSKWVDFLRKEHPSEDAIRAAGIGIEKAAQIIRRILSIGTKWNDDEILLVLQKRIEIDLLLHFLNECCSRQLSIPLDDVDEAILHLANSKENKRDFKLVVNQIKKNWGLPIESKWLKEDLIG